MTTKSKAAKPPMPEEKITGTLPALKLELMNDMEHFSSGNLAMVLDGMTISRDGKELGTVQPEIRGCGLKVHINGEDGKNGRSWFLTSRSLWEAALKVDAEYMKRYTEPRNRRSHLRFSEIERTAAKIAGAPKKDKKS
jgi:hypothetical protein